MNMNSFNSEEVVISGIGGYFPKAKNIEEFKDALLSNESLLGSRWKAGERGVTNRVGVINDIECFDTSYFGIHREQCKFMDPMQRLILERTFEALIDAGVNPMDIRGKKIAVYTGSSIGENDNLFYESIISGFGITGHSRSMMPNRISYWLNLKGPSCAYDNNWLNGVEVLQSAFDSIRFGHCEAAIVATANLTLNSEISWVYNDMGLLSPDGCTRSFDNNANGYGRSDGIIVLYVQRACHAKRSYATILGVNSRFNGNREGGFRDLNTDAMTNFIQEFYDDCNIDPKNVEFVECYGSGLKHTDEVELTAIERVYCKNRETPLLIGSVKSNSGHAEASAILVSLAKVLIAMESGIIPANIDYDSPNQNVAALIDGRMQVVTKNQKWNGGLIAINGIGLASSYGHILLKANSKCKVTETSDLPKLINISTRTEEGIKNIFSLLESKSTIDCEYAALIQDVFKKSIPGHVYRGYSILNTEDSKHEFEYFPGNKRPLWFVYSGMGSQWCTMGVDLMKFPVFATAIHKCHKVLEPKGIDLLKIITEDDKNMFDNILNSFVGIAAIQIGLTDILFSLGIVPDGIIGHSVGELGCAYADHCLTAEQMILCAYSRGKASLEAELIVGMMAAVGKGYQQMKNECPPSIEVACHNGPDSCTLSGPTDDMKDFVKKLVERDIFARLVNVSNIAYHSRYIKPAAPLLLNYLKEIIPNPLPRSSKWISTSVPEENWETDQSKMCSAEYHTNNLLGTVLFEEGSKHIPKESIVVEIAPHGLLQAILKRSLKANCTNIPLTRKTSKNGIIVLLEAIGKMYAAGVDVNVSALYPPIEYPVGRGTDSLAPLVFWEHSEKWHSGAEDKLNYLTNVRDLMVSLTNEEYKDLDGHQLQSTIVIPISIYLGILYEILAASRITKVTDVVFENLKFKNIIAVPKRGSVPLYIMIQKANGEFEISSGDELIGIGVIRIPESEKIFANVSEFDVNENSFKLTDHDIYREFYHRDHKYKGIYKSIKELTLTEKGSIGNVCNNNWSNMIESMLQQCIFHKAERNQNTVTISSIQRIAMSMQNIPNAAELETVYEYSTGIISATGIQISGITIKPLSLKKQQLSYNSIELSPLSNANYTNIETGINASLYLVINNFQNKNTNSVMIVEAATDNPLLEENIKNVTNKYNHISANVSVVKDIKMILISQTDPLLVVINNKVDDDCVKLLTSSHAFLLARTDKNILSYHQITQLLQFFVDGVCYSLLRKTSDGTPTLVHIEADTLTATDLLQENLNLEWVSQFKTAVNISQGKVYLVAYIIPLEGITNFVQDVCTNLNASNIRFIFILDEKPFPFTGNEDQYKHIFEQDLQLVVIKNGRCSSYISVPVEYKDHSGITLQTTSNMIDNVCFNYLGLNLFDETLILKGEREVKLGNLDYSGISSSGRKIMGLSRFDKEFCKLVPDSILQWEIPENWSLQDAVTVPHAYITAYYALVYLANSKPNETVLIHNACSAIGLASISIATAIGCTVFVTVTTEKQKAFIKKQFSRFIDRNILSACDTSFEPHLLMATGGMGAQVILNCVSGTMLNATLQCVAEFGRVIQLGKLDVDDDNEIGMSVFLKNVSLIGINPEDVFDASDDVKRELHNYVTEGIKMLTVRPLHRQLADYQDIEFLLKTLKQPENIGKIVLKIPNNLALGLLNINNTSQFICDSQNSYLIYGGPSDVWTDVVEWLILRGARKILVASDLMINEAHLQRRLSLLQTYFNAEISFTSKRAYTKNNASELLSEAYSLGPIEAVFVLPINNSEIKHTEVAQIHNLESALKIVAPKAMFINFINKTAGICHLRADAGFLVYNIQWENTLEFSDVIQSLDDILKYKVKNIFVNAPQLTDIVQETPQSLYKKLSLLFPSSIEELMKEVYDAPKDMEFLQLPSLCARVIRESPPVFIFPGLFGRNDIKQLSYQLLYPVYCANYPNMEFKIPDIAAKAATKIKEIYPKGPYNVIGVSYGGIFALEVAKHLETGKATVRLHLIDGAPETIKGILKHLDAGSNSDVSFLCRIMNLTNPDVLKSMSAFPDWESRLQFALKQYKCPSNDKNLLGTVLTFYKNYLNDILLYQPSEQIFVGSVNLLRPKGSNEYDDCRLTKYCKQNAEIFVVDADYQSMLQEKGVATIINDKVLC